jgi:ABC-type branched-subunit amino acid transport system substrate-binding protein
VLAVMGNLGTAINVSLLRYFRDTNVPNLLAISGAAAVNDPAHFPQTVPLLVQYRTEGKVYALHLLKEKSDAKIAVLYQDDILGRDYRAGFRAGLGDRAATMVVAEAAYQLSDPSVDSQVITLQSSGADTLVLFTTPKFAAQALRKTADLGWKPLRIVDINSATVLKPLGAGISTGVLSSNFEKDALDPTWTDDPDMKAYRVFMRKYVPNVDPDDNGAPLGYGIAFVMIEVLKRCGDDLTREHLLDVVTHLRGFHTPVGLPGTTVDYSPTDYDAQKQFQILRYDGTHFVPVGALIKG